ncbi:hypothetical protein [Sphingomonas beigongshangi]|uniref:LexA family protein n=1 Tax=Sphingomonas beigongshangi TaxID=2782540 RepID=UPI00193B9C5F
MSHTQFNLARMLSWIELTVETGDPAPSDAEICELFNFTSTEKARTLLAELADQGKIRIDWKAEPRAITLGGKAASAFALARPLAGTVVRRDYEGKPVQVHPETVLAKPHTIHVAQERHRLAPDQPSRVDQIRAAAARLASRDRAPAPAPTRIPAPVAPPATKPAPAAEPVKRLTSPGKGMGKGWKPATVARRQDRRQLNVHFPSDRYDEIVRITTATGSTPSAWARDVFMAALGDPTFDKGRKPFIPADVIRAAADAGQPLDVFVTSLIARGFAAFTASNGASA